MAKQKKNNHSIVPPVPREAIAAIASEEDLVELLRRELEWPIPMTVQRLADVSIPHDLQNDFGSQRTLRKGDLIWNRNDLLFICTPGWMKSGNGLWG